VPDIPAPAKADGVNLRDNWTFEIVDESLIPREYLIPDEVKIRKVVVALKDKTNIPGVKAINRPIIVKARGVLNESLVNGQAALDGGSSYHRFSFSVSYDSLLPRREVV